DNYRKMESSVGDLFQLRSASSRDCSRPNRGLGCKRRHGQDCRGKRQRSYGHCVAAYRHGTLGTVVLRARAWLPRSRPLSTDSKSAAYLLDSYPTNLHHLQRFEQWVLERSAWKKPQQSTASVWKSLLRLF